MDSTSGAVTVVLTDGRKLLLNVAQPMPADLVAFEERYDVSAEALSQPNARIVWSIYIIWRIARRVDAAIMAAPFEDFVELVEDIIKEDAEVPDPTPDTPPTA
jgi:hypothetical protein